VRPTPENPTYSSIAVVFGIKGAIRQAIFSSMKAVNTAKLDRSQYIETEAL
jgi:hypothetical protein